MENLYSMFLQLRFSQAIKIRNISRITTAKKKSLLDTTSENIYCGFELSKHSRPIRDHGSKWFVSEKSFNGLVYPEFCHGGMYILTTSTVAKIFEMSLVTNFSDFHLEDVLITGILRLKLNLYGSKINLTPIHNFNNRPLMFHIPNGQGSNLIWRMYRKWTIWKNELILARKTSFLSF